MPRVSDLVEAQAAQEQRAELALAEEEEPKPDMHVQAVQGTAETYEVKVKKMAVRSAPNTSSDVVLVLHQGERVCGVPQEADGLPWLRLSRETMKSHPLFSALEQEFAWVLVDASDTDLGLGRLLERAAMELGWCAAEGKRSEVWEVVGKGSVTVTIEKDCSSDSEGSLEPGSLIKALEHDTDEGRLHYRLLAGKGLEEGWVTVDRLVRISHRRAAPAAAQQRPAVELDEEKVEKALKWYGEAFCRKSEARGPCALKKTSLPWRAGSAKAALAPAAPAAELRRELEAALEPDAADVATEEEPKQQEGAKDEKKEAEICGACCLPLGDLVYPNGNCSVHAECMAQILLQEMKEEEDERQRNFQLRKKMRHEEFGVGWSAAKIPLNSAPLKKLSGEDVRHGLLALALTPEGGVTLVPTACPGAAVNLEYLSAALKIRLEEGTEPTFSLDPVDPKLDNTMQIKRFEPAWLKGTAAGDVLFESDYLLKELSLGEFDQPVLGMRSCLDHFDSESNKEWNAREWYVVRKAEVQMSEDGVLVPWCKMGVEAREQIINEKGELEDQRMTRPDHPLVKFAEDFSKNFDLIAERKSAVYHLRELAKASVLAKYLEQSDVELEGIWCDLYGEREDDSCVLEVPQIWNERLKSQIQVRDGRIVDDNDKSRTVYGGARFGLNRLRMSPIMAAGSLAAGAIQARRGFIPPRMGFQARRGFVPSRGFVAPSSALTARRGFVAPTAAARGFLAPSAAISARPGFFVSPSKLSMPTMSATMPLRGVDLNLDRFNLTETPVSARKGPLALSEDLADCTALGSAFWPHLDKAEGSILGEEERGFLKEVFHPCLSDRRMEGELFVPPDTSAAYGDALQGMLRQEREVRQRRRDHFLSTSFAPGEACPLFPFSWAASIEIARGGQASPKRAPPAQANLKPLADFEAEAPRIKTALESSTPVFERRAEDGLGFRIYRLGSLEVRTTQEHGGEELIGAVFVARAAKEEEAEEDPRPAVEADEKVQKATLFVEGSAEECAYYVVLETVNGSVIVTEKLRDGTATWEENPRGLAERNSLAKVIRAADGLAAETDSATVHTLKIYQGSRTRSDVSSDARQRYAECAFSRVARRSRGQQLAEPFETYAARNYPRLHALLGLAEKKAEVA